MAQPDFPESKIWPPDSISSPRSCRSRPPATDPMGQPFGKASAELVLTNAARYRTLRCPAALQRGSGSCFFVRTRGLHTGPLRGVVWSCAAEAGVWKFGKWKVTVPSPPPPKTIQGQLLFKGGGGENTKSTRHGTISSLCFQLSRVSVGWGAVPVTPPSKTCLGTKIVGARSVPFVLWSDRRTAKTAHTSADDAGASSSWAVVCKAQRVCPRARDPGGGTCTTLDFTGAPVRMVPNRMGLQRNTPSDVIGA